MKSPRCLLRRRNRACPTGVWTSCALPAALLLFALAMSGQAQSPALDELLNHTGRATERFLEEISGVTCRETVAQKKLGKEEKLLYQQESVFDSLTMFQLTGSELTVEESRLVQSQSGNAKNYPLLVTNGFSTLALIFHPFYQNSFEFLQLTDEVVEGKRLLRVGFHHIHGSRSPTVLQLRGRNYPLELKGTAWIDPDSGAITKITTSLASSMEDVGLQAFQSEVHYAPTRFAADGQEYWLPVEARIEVETPRQHWRNTHRFTDYKRFSVSTQSSVGEPE